MQRVLVLLVLILGIPLAGMADQITLGDSCSSGSMTIVNGAPPGISGGFSGCLATFESGGEIALSDLKYSITSTGFSVSDESNSLSGTISWLSGQVGVIPETEQMGGLLAVTSVSGFNGEYAQGGVYNFDLTLTGCHVTDSFTCNGTSSGQVPVPEPATLTLLGTGLVGLSGLVQRKSRAK